MNERKGAMIQYHRYTTSKLARLLESYDDRELEKRLTPAGSSPAHGSGDRSRSDDPSPTNFRHSSAVREAKGRVELKRLVDYLEEEAEMMDEISGYVGDDYDPRVEQAAKENSADYKLWASLVRALCAEPRPQSECIEDAAEGSIAFTYDFLDHEAAKLERLADTSERCMPSPYSEKQWRERAAKLRIVMDLLATQRIVTNERSECS